MIFYKIYLSNNYDTEQEISNRPLERGYIKAGAGNLINGIPFLVVFVDNDMLVHEYFTNNYLRISNLTGNSEDDGILTFNELIQFNFDLVSEDELNTYSKLRANKDLKKVIRKVIFNEDNEFEVTTPEECDQDRLIQENAFNNNLTSINPNTDSYLAKQSLRLVR